MLFKKKKYDDGMVMGYELERERKRMEALEMVLFLLIFIFSYAGGVSVGGTVYDVLKSCGFELKRSSVASFFGVLSFVTLIVASRNFDFFTDEWKKEADYWEDRCHRLESELKKQNIPTEKIIYNAVKEANNKGLEIHQYAEYLIMKAQAKIDKETQEALNETK